MEENLLELSTIFENQFSYDQYNGVTISKLPYEIKLGSQNILISAPHAVNHLRENKVKTADMWTGSLASIIQLYTNCFCIYSTRISDEDPNYILGGIYKSALKEICQTYNIKMVIDLHGASLNRDFDIDLGTLNGASMNEKNTEILKTIFSNNEIHDVRLNDTFSASHKGTIAAFTKNELNIEAVQVEINRSFRSPANDIDSFKRLVLSLIEMVDLFGKEME